MHLYGSLASPFVQRCAIVARAKGHDIAIQPPPGGMQSAEFQAISPMGRIPILALDDGSHVCESSAIIASLDEMLEGPSLALPSAAERSRAREIDAIAQGELAAGLRPVMVHRVFRVSENEPLVAASLAQADRGCVALERLMGDTPYAVGSTLSIADAALTPFVTLMTIIAGQPEVAAMLARHPFLTRYLERAQKDPILARSIEEMRAGFAAIQARIAAQRAQAQAQELAQPA